MIVDDGLNPLLIGPILILLLGMTIFVHEFGHYLAARWLGLVVEVFSIGFGPSIWKKKIKGIVYKIGWIPFGGYVALPQLDPTGMSLIQEGAENGSEDVKKNKDGEDQNEGPVMKYPSVAPWKKIVVAFAGAAGNIILAVIIAWVVYLKGMPAGPAERTPIAGYVDPECKAYQLGLRTGDRIITVNNVLVKNWREVVMEAALHKEVTVKAIGTNDGTEKTITIPTEKGMLGEQTIAGVGGLNLCSVLSVEPGKSAEKAGIKGGDVIVGFAGGPVFSTEHFSEMIKQYKEQDIPIKVSRFVQGKREIVSLTVTPQYDEVTKRVRVGLMWNRAAVDADTVIKPLPSEQMKDHATAIFRVLKALTTPQQAKAAASAVGGPVAIIISYWYIVKTSIMLAIWFTGLLNVNLAILNLLPIPVLDGGHIMFSLWEMVTRRPAHPKVVNALVNVFVILFIMFAIFISYRDVDRLTPARRVIRGVLGKQGNGAATNTVAIEAQPVTNAITGAK